MQNKIKLLREKLEKVYGGDPWYGNSAKSVLKNIDPEAAFIRVERNTHTIAELVSHITAWREFVSARLSGDNDFRMLQKISFDWKRIDKNKETAWKNLLTALDKSQREILATLKKTDDDFLNRKVYRKRYNMEFLIEGSIQHDLYHLGQISLLKKMNNGKK
jgi:uncharacterized damage-inducible protein DinB